MRRIAGELEGLTDDELRKGKMDGFNIFELLKK
jgi:hypothetical protein